MTLCDIYAPMVIERDETERVILLNYLVLFLHSV